MMAKLKSISRESAQTYRIVLEEEEGGSRTFLFDVEEGDIKVVKWRDDFAEYMRQNLGPASRLFESILVFHLVSGVRVPDDLVDSRPAHHRKQMTATLKSITRQRALAYKVVLEDASGAVREFVFDIHEGEIQVVSCRDDFAAYMKMNLGPASSLFAAILAFHRVSALNVVDD